MQLLNLNLSTSIHSTMCYLIEEQLFKSKYNVEVTSTQKVYVIFYMKKVFSTIPS